MMEEKFKRNLTSTLENKKITLLDRDKASRWFQGLIAQNKQNFENQAKNFGIREVILLQENLI